MRPCCELNSVPESEILVRTDAARFVDAEWTSHASILAW